MVLNVLFKRLILLCSYCSGRSLFPGTCSMPAHLSASQIATKLEFQDGISVAIGICNLHICFNFLRSYRVCGLFNIF